MHHPRLLCGMLTLGVIGLWQGPTLAAPLGTAFTHRGEYKPSGTAVSGVYDFQLVLFNVATAGTPVSTVLTKENVSVIQGNFTVELDYGATPFATATQYWVETRVRAGTSTGAFTTLAPRLKMNAVPYALNVRTLPPNIVTGSHIAANAVGPVAILDNSIGAADIGTNAVGLTEINTTQVQARVSGICAPGSSMQAIAQNGTVTCEPDGANAWRVSGNAGTNPTTHFLGTTDNQPLNIRVNNQRVARFEPNLISPNVIEGHSVNFVTPGVRGATISGGGVPAGDTDPTFPGEGPNRVTDAYGVVSGGYSNQAGDNAGTTLERPFATVGGGTNNTAGGETSTVGGGRDNTASDYTSTVAGGNTNTASGYTSTVAGGFSNTANGQDSTVAGGANNTASGDNSTVVGGELNTASGATSTVAGGETNTASGPVTAVGGGYLNTAIGHGSTVAGGERNIAGGINSAVAGGNGNTANGDYSFVVGRLAKNSDPLHDGVFMFADSLNVDFFSAGANTFNVRAQGGAHFNAQTSLFFGAQTRQMLNLWNAPAIDNYGIGVQANTLYFRTGNHFAWFRDGIHNDNMFNPGSGGTEIMRLDTNGNLSILGALSSLSDRAMKADFAAVNSLQVLERVIALPIQSWRYKSDHATRHLGPMAQDFYAAFGVGADDKHIATVDADGVALAAIQGLNQKLARENAKLKAENTDISARLARLEAQAVTHKRTQARLERLEARFEALFHARAEK